MDSLKRKFGSRWAYRCAPAIQGMPWLIRVGDEALDVSKFDPKSAEMLCRKRPKASGRSYRPERLSLPPEAQARHEWKEGVVSMVRLVFGEPTDPRNTAQ